MLLILLQRYVKKFKLDIRHLCFIFGTYYLLLSHAKCYPYFIFVYFVCMSYGMKNVRIPRINSLINSKIFIIFKAFFRATCFMLAISFFVVSSYIIKYFSFTPFIVFEGDVEIMANYIVENYDINKVRLYTSFNDGGYYEFRGIKVYMDPRAELFYKKVNKKEDIYIEKARKYAYDIWGFFKDNVTENDNHLPPDNISLAPREAVAHRTSPTNIGLYLLSVLCAADMGFITVSELEERLRNTLSTLMRMRRYKGHFYNWYDTESLRVLSPSYISTVDSGNLTACLITLRMGLRDHVSESTSLLEIIKTVQELEEETDYSFLYDNERELYALGAQIHPDGKAEISPNRYDLMMSEARTISYIQCAKRNVPKKHWTSLSRFLISSDGYIGLASWTGTAFEYFMPHIFLPLCRRSLCGEAMHFALHEQIKRRAQRHGLSIFGISESGYYAFDAGMSYRYRAFGIPSLALKDGQEKDLVISPYSTFLALCTSKKRAFANLAAMEKAGLYGKYGFYEAVDMTDGRCAKNGSVVKSYMSHHLGMSM